MFENLPLQPMLFGNTIGAYVNALGSFILLLLLFSLLHTLVLKRARTLAAKTSTDFDDLLIGILNKINPALYTFLALVIALRSLAVHALFSKTLETLALAWIVWYAIRALHELLAYTFKKRFEKHDQERAFKSMSTLINVVLWSLGLLFLLSNLGVNVTSIIAGLGIGGIAVAFALQNILSDLFSSFALQFDRPFTIGDRITIGAHSGTVEKIGIRTTRLRNATGDEVVIPNKDLASSVVINHSHAQ